MCLHIKKRLSYSSLYTQGLPVSDLNQLFNTFLKNEWVNIKPYLKYILDESSFFYHLLWKEIFFVQTLQKA